MKPAIDTSSDRSIEAMHRLLQVLVLAVWIAGGIGGDLAGSRSASAPDQTSMHLLINTDCAKLQVDHRQIVLTIETPWQSEWRVTTPTPSVLVPHGSEHPPSAPASETVPLSTSSFFPRPVPPSHDPHA